MPFIITPRTIKFPGPPTKAPTKEMRTLHRRTQKGRLGQHSAVERLNLENAGISVIWIRACEVVSIKQQAGDLSLDELILKFIWSKQRLKPAETFWKRGIWRGSCHIRQESVPSRHLFRWLRKEARMEKQTQRAGGGCRSSALRFSRGRPAEAVNYVLTLRAEEWGPESQKWTLNKLQS